MSGLILAVVILVLALGGIAWFLIARNNGKSSKGLAFPGQAPLVSGTTAGDEKEGSANVEDPADEDADGEDDDLSWRQKVERADQKKAAGDYEDAIDLYEEALEKAREELGRDSVEVAGILLKQGAAYQARDDEEDDEDTTPACYPRALSILEQRFGVFDERVLPALSHLASFFDQTGRHSDAESLQRRCEDIMSRTRRNRTIACASPEVAEPTAPAVVVPQVNTQPAGTTGEPLCQEAEAHMARFEYDDAVSSYETALEEAREQYGRDSLILVPILMGLGKAYQDRDDEDDYDSRDDYPENYYVLALAIVQRQGGLFDERLLPIIVRLASYYDEIGEHNKAETMIRRLDSIERNIADQQRENRA